MIMENLPVDVGEFCVSTMSLTLSDDEGDDEVFYEIEDTRLAMANSLNPFPARRGSRMSKQRSSVFELPTGMSLRSHPMGSSIMSFGVDPHMHEEHQIHRPKAKVQYENTFQMQPPQKFQPDKVNKMIYEFLEQNLADKMYDPIECGLLCKSIAQEIKAKVKELDLKRYKIVATVTIGEKKDQDVRFGSRCVWDTAWDNYASASYESPKLYATGVVYALYYE